MVQKSSQPVDMVDYPLFTRFYHHPRWLFGISEPSIVFCLTFWSSKLRLRSCVWKTQVWCVKKIRRYQHELIHLRFSISSRWWCPRCWLWHDDRHILTFLTDLSLMVDGNPANHLLYIYIWNPINSGIFTISTGVRFLLSTAWIDFKSYLVKHVEAWGISPAVFLTLQMADGYMLGYDRVCRYMISA